MSNQKLGILAVVAAVMVLLAVITSRTSINGRSTLSGPAYLIQGLDPASIDSITVGQGKDQVKIRRQGSPVRRRRHATIPRIRNRSTT